MKTITAIIVTALFNLNISYAESNSQLDDMSINGGLPAVGSGFSYQGELINSGSPANGSFDFSFRLYTAKVGGVPSSSIVNTPTVTVTNGLFSIEKLDFGANPFVGSEQWLQVKVKPTGSGSYTTLAPLQRVGAVPYAVQARYLDSTGASNNDVLVYNGIDWAPSTSVSHATTANTASGLTIAGASNGDVLQFDGTNWVANALSGGSSPWVVNGSDISYTLGRVGVNIASPSAQLSVNTSSSIVEPFRVQKLNNTKLYVASNGGTSLGSEFNPPADGIRVEGESYFKGKVGINVQNPSAKLEIQSDAANENPLVVKTGSSEKLVVNDNGGTSIGSSTIPPSDGLVVEGVTYLKGKVGVNVQNPSAKLEIQSNAANENPLVVKTGSSQKLVVNDNGGTSIGSAAIPPVNGIRVEGDVKQSNTSNGMIKYMVDARCYSSNPVIFKYYDGINPANVNAPVTIASGGTAYECRINFPTNINNRYWQVSVVTSPDVSSRCYLVTNDNDTLYCNVFATNAQNQLVFTFGRIHVLIY